MKKIFENKKVRIAATAVLLVIIVVVIVVSAKSCSKESDRPNGNTGIEQGQENGKDEEGLTVVEPEDEKTENGIDVPSSWDEPSKPSKSSEKSKPSKPSEKSKPDNAGNENDKKSDDADNTTQEDGDDILQDDKKWGDIF